MRASDDEACSGVYRLPRAERRRCSGLCINEPQRTQAGQWFELWSMTLAMALPSAARLPGFSAGLAEYPYGIFACSSWRHTQRPLLSLGFDWQGHRRASPDAVVTAPPASGSRWPHRCQAGAAVRAQQACADAREYFHTECIQTAIEYETTSSGAKSCALVTLNR